MGDEAQSAVRLAHNASIRRLAQDKQLTREVFLNVPPGESIPDEFAKQIAKYWRVSRFVPFAPEDGVEGFSRLAIHASVDLPTSFFDALAERGPQRGLGGFVMALGAIAQAHGHEGLQRIASEIEDEAYAKLTRIGVGVLEREELRTILQERAMPGLGAGFDDSKEYGLLACATHVAIIEIGPSARRGGCRVSVRLDDADTGEVVWADVRDRLIRRHESADRYLLDFGNLVVINSNRYRGRTDTAGLHLSPIDRESTEQLLARVAYAEPSGDSRFVRIRDLFSSQSQVVERSRVDAATSKTVESIEDIPPAQLMRYGTPSRNTGEPAASALPTD